jgi:hypothetical protein
VELDFFLPTLAPNGHPLDVDNLCEPVFSVVVNKLGWFGSRRPNMLWWLATKVVGQPSGLRLSMRSERALAARAEEGCAVLEATYTGPLPKKATDTEVPRWLASLGLSQRVQSDDRFAVHFLLGGARVNLGDVATGTVKSLLDCLYPVLGGRAGDPEDWRVDNLLVQKCTADLEENQVRILVWRA